jgi:hypothetical protein
METSSKVPLVYVTALAAGEYVLSVFANATPSNNASPVGEFAFTVTADALQNLPTLAAPANPAYVSGGVT